MSMNIYGFLTGLYTFLLIGVFHPVVIKMEYHLGKRYWWILFIPGLAFALLSLFLRDVYSVISGVFGFVLLWSTKELFKQHQRVKKRLTRINPE